MHNFACSSPSAIGKRVDADHNDELCRVILATANGQAAQIYGSHPRFYKRRAGWYVDVTESFDIGFDVRYSEAEVTIFDRDIEAGGMHYATTASYHW